MPDFTTLILILRIRIPSLPFMAPWRAQVPLVSLLMGNETNNLFLSSRNINEARRVLIDLNNFDYVEI